MTELAELLESQRTAYGQLKRDVLRGFAAFCIFPISIWAADSSPWLMRHIHYLMFIDAVLLAIAIRPYKRYSFSDPRRIAQCKLTPSDLGPLLDAWSWAHGGLRVAVEEALIRLLPSVLFTDGQRLSARSRAILLKILRRNDTVLVRSTLQALRHIGDDRELSHVRTLAEGRGRLGRHKAIKEAAVECQRLVNVRACAQPAGVGLLRPVHEVGEADLLRTVEGPRPPVPNTLLQPSTQTTWE